MQVTHLEAPSSQCPLLVSDGPYQRLLVRTGGARPEVVRRLTPQDSPGNLVQMQPLFPQGLAGDRRSKHLPGEPVQPILTLRISFPPSLHGKIAQVLTYLLPTPAELVRRLLLP